MLVPMLPALKSNPRTSIPVRGEWVRQPSQAPLTNLVGDIKVSANDHSNITAIPDLWARPAMVEQILFNEKHYLHNKYVAEWRGTLAIIALKEMRNFNFLRVEDIKIPPVAKLRESDSEFFKVIAKLFPKELEKKIYKDNTVTDGYHKIQVITAHEKPFAIVWPTTLIVPAVELQCNVKDRINWWGANEMNDPVNDLGNDEKVTLVKWIDKIIDALPDNDAKLSKVMDLLVEFKEDLDCNDEDADEANFEEIATLGITGLCSFLGKNYVISRASKDLIKVSNIRLINKRSSSKKTLLVMDESIPIQWNTNSSDVVVAGHMCLDAALPATGRISDATHIGNIVLSKDKSDTPENAELRMGSSFFNNKVAIIYNGESVFPGAQTRHIIKYQGLDVNVITPIKKELLDYLGPDYLAQNIKITEGKNKGDIDVELWLPLSGLIEEGTNELKERKLKLTKTYSNRNEENKEIVTVEAPVIQVWPNFIMEDKDQWQAYYSFYDDKANETNTFFATPYSYGDNNYDYRKIGIEDGNAQIVKSTSFPEAFLCEKAEEEIGVILLNKPKTTAKRAAAKRYTIGIDFGTTNTVAYMYDGDSRSIIKFEDNMIFEVTDAKNSPDSLEEMRHYFIPATTQPSGVARSIRTIFNTNLTKHNDTVTLNQPLFRGNIYYINNDSEMESIKEALESLETDNMKWEETNNMTGFLFQLGMQCLAFAVRNGATHINWKYSYPTSFSKGQLMRYMNTWQNNLMPYFKKVAAGIEMPDEENRTESVAMAQFFASHPNVKADILRGIVCFDIGGGSTDIAIWQGKDENIKYQTSLRFAGKNILNDYLWQKRDVITDLRPEGGAFGKIFDYLRTGADTEKNFNIILEMLLKYHDNDIFANLNAASNKDSVKKLVRDITFAVSGIFFYTGYVLGYLRVNDLYSKEDLPYCYVGGNASKLLNWMAMGVFKNNSMIADIPKTCFKAGLKYVDTTANDDSAFEIFRTILPKEEVAYGLVVDSRLDSKKDVNGIVVAGEDFLVDNVDLDKSDISAEDILKLVSVPKSCPAFKEFISSLNKALKELEMDAVEFDNITYNEIVSGVNSELNKKRKAGEEKADNIVVEPLFIMLLRKALDVLAKLNL